MNSARVFSAKLGVCGCLRRIRGELGKARISRRKLVSGRLVGILTMMQPCASAAKLRAAGPFFWSASVPCSNYGFPPPRIVNSAAR
jgi:hypothetical protein